MATFKMGRGPEDSIPETITDGFLYFCTDSGNVYIDWLNKDGDLVRSPANASCAQKFRYKNENDEYVEVNIDEYVNAAIDSFRQEILGGEW